MLSDPISDMLTRIKNAYMVGKQDIVLPSSRVKFAIAKILKENGYIKNIEERGDKKKELKIDLLYKDNKPALENIKRVSKPGRRAWYSPFFTPGFVCSTNQPVFQRTSRNSLSGSLGKEAWGSFWYQ